MSENADQPALFKQSKVERPDGDGDAREPLIRKGWPLRHISSELAAVQNMLCPRRASINISGGGIAIRAILAGPMTLPGNSAWIACEIDDQPAWIGADRNQLSQLVGIPVGNTAPSDIALLIEEALSAALDDIETQTGIALRILCLTDKVPPTEILRLSLQIELISRAPARTKRLHLPLLLSPAAGRILAPVLARWHAPRAKSLPLQLRVAVEIETMKLSLGELQALRPGDALVLPDLPASASILVENQMTAAACPVAGEALPSAWALTAPIAPRLPLGGSEEKHDKGSRTVTPPRTTMDSLELRLSIRLGETLMALADLHRAGPGTIVVLDRSDDAMVDIFAGKHHFGTGEIISIAGQRAIEIHGLLGQDRIVSREDGCGFASGNV